MSRSSLRVPFAFPPKTLWDVILESVVSKSDFILVLHLIAWVYSYNLKIICPQNFVNKSGLSEPPWLWEPIPIISLLYISIYMLLILFLWRTSINQGIYSPSSILTWHSVDLFLYQFLYLAQENDQLLLTLLLPLLYFISYRIPITWTLISWILSFMPLISNFHLFIFLLKILK